jgi:putative ABC transport system permease protein
MTMLRGIVLRLRALFAKRGAEMEFDEEMRHHLELETEKNLGLGLPPDEAARRARLAFGGAESTREAHRDARGVRWLEDFLADVRYALRSLRRSPVLAAAAILTLALGIGANTAIFSAVNAVILRPLPFPGADRLVMLWEQNPEKGWYKNVVAPANMLDWKEQVGAFTDVMAWADWHPKFTLSGEGRPRLLDGAMVTGNFFSVLGVPVERGRGFTPEETWKGGGDVAVISDRLWRDQYGGDPSVIGRTLQINAQPVQVVGVMPRGFSFPYENVDVWVPTAWDPANQSQIFFRRAHWLRVVARLKAGVTQEQADAQLQVVMHRLSEQYPATNRVMGAGLTPLHEFLVGDTRQPLLILLGAVALLLLIACVNVGNLLLVRAAGLEREAALRLALGAGRLRLVRQALTESLVLSALGGAAGLLLGWWGTHALVLLQPPGMLPVERFGVSWAVLVYTMIVTTCCGLLFGIAPAVWGAHRVPAEVLKEGGKAGSGGHRVRRWSDLLVVAEVSLALLLTVGAGLLVRSFWRLQEVDPGFNPHGVLAVSLNLPEARYDTHEKLAGFFAELEAKARALPGVESAAITSMLPLTGVRWTSDFTVAGWRPDQAGFEVGHKEVTPDYFKTMGIPLLRGRAFTAADGKDAPRVVLINQALAEQYFPGQDPVGQRIVFDKVPDSSSVWRTIVGVVGNEHQEALSTEPKIEFVTPAAQNDRSTMHLVIRTTGDPGTLGGPIRALIAALDPDLAISQITTMDEIRSQSLARQRFMLTLLLAFAVVGLVLAVVGVYGVMAQMARGRIREMGIRMALGAQAEEVQWLVVRHGLRLVLIGLGLGIVVALMTTRAMTSILYQIAPADPATFVTVPLLLVFSGLVACWLPALRASRANPSVALRVD